MATQLNQRAYAHAKSLISHGDVVQDARDDWSEQQPSAAQENAFIKQHDFDEYAKWYLGIDTDQSGDTKEKYKFPYGDFKSIHRSGVLAAEARAGQYKYHDIKNAAAHLHGMIDGVQTAHESN